MSRPGVLTVLAGLLLIPAAGCHLIFPFSVLAPDGSAPAADADGGDDRLDGPVVTADLKLLGIAFKYPGGNEVKVGQHVPVELALSGVEGKVPLRVAATTCLVTVAGSKAAAQTLQLTASSPGVQKLALFAPLSARPGSSCGITVTVGSFKYSATLSVKPADYGLSFFAGYAVTAITGLRVTKLGTLAKGGPVQGIASAGGSFSGDLVVGTGTSSSGTKIDPSTVRIYRLKPSGAQGTIGLFYDLFGQSKNPTVLDDLFWSDIGPCKPDAVYLVAQYSDWQYGTDKVSGSVTCLDAGKQLKEAYNVSARSAAIVPAAGFVPTAKAGSLLYAADTKTYLLVDPTAAKSEVTGAAGGGHNQLRFAGAGAFKGHLFSVDTGSSETLFRINPPPAQQAHQLAVLGHSELTIALSGGGTFGTAVVSARRAKYGIYDLFALVEAAGKVLEVPLLTAVTCGYAFAFTAGGEALILMAGAETDTGCKGQQTAYRLEFDLP